MTNMDLFILGAGILWGMLYYQRTGRACGGIITPGLIAVNIAYPGAILYSIASALLIAVVLEIAVRFYSLYGRQRISVAMVLALILRMATISLFPSASLWVGWIIPALIASDIQKQGLSKTLSATVSVTIVALMTGELASLLLI